MLKPEHSAAGSNLIDFSPIQAYDDACEDAQDATTVMLVDDQPVFREVARALLERDGDFSVVAEADDGGDAVGMVDDVRPDVVVMDIQMCDMGGLEATRRILANDPGTNVVLTSMNAESEYPRLVGELGALAFIAKRNLNAISLRAVLGIAPRPAPLAA